MEDTEDKVDYKARQCEECRQVFPLLPKYWKRRVGSQTTFSFVCRSCTVKKQRAKKIAQIEDNAVAAFSAKASMGGSSIPHSSELLECIMGYFGGVNGFASLLMKQYFEAPAGGRLRTNILESIVRLTVKNTDQGGAKKPVTLYSDEELETEINKRLEQAILTYNGHRYLNAPQEEASPTSAAGSHPGLPQPVELPTGRTEATASGIEREADRSLKAVQAYREAVGVSHLHIERDPGDRGESVG